MKIKLLLLSSTLALTVGVLLGDAGNALSLKIAPLEYRATLKENEKQRGFIDVSNPYGRTINVRVSVQAFKQVNDDGGLQFYDDEQTKAGIVPELTQFELGPREALRLFFTIDGAALPRGDNYGAIFVTTDPVQPKAGVGQVVRVGTLLSITNKTPGSRKAELTSLRGSFIQIGSTAQVTYDIKNTGPNNTGFYPEVSVSSWPKTESKSVRSPLVFGGRTREKEVSVKTGYGIHKIETSYGASKKSLWVITLAPWMIVLTLLIVLVVSVELLLLKRRRKSKRKKVPSTSDK